MAECRYGCDCEVEPDPPPTYACELSGGDAEWQSLDWYDRANERGFCLRDYMKIFESMVPAIAIHALTMRASPIMQRITRG